MGKLRLKQFLTHRLNGASLLNDLISSGMPLRIFDAQQNILLDQASSETPAYPIMLGDDTLGWVCGEYGAQVVATLVSHLVRQEATNGDIADEALELYRELNLLFKLSEKLSVSLELSTLTAIILEEANRLIQATSGAIIAFDDNRGKLLTLRTFGSQLPADGTYQPGVGIIGKLAFSLQGEIINGVIGDQRYTVQDGVFSSLVCVPLKAKGQTIGILLLVNENTIAYTSRDFKLLLTLASQAAPAIDNAQLYEKTVLEASIRETQLHKRIEALRIELDENKQQEKVKEITESEYFQSLRKQTDILRNIIENGENT